MQSAISETELSGRGKAGIAFPSGEVVGRVQAGGARRYYLKDHLGSIRAVLDGSGNAAERRGYYPFGLPMPGRYEKGSPPTQEDYTGHVKDDATGLHYAGARYYSSAFGRWTTIDPLADAYPSLTPYNYVENNPTGMVDPSGLASRGASRLTSPVYNPDGELLGTDDEGLQGEPIIMEEDEFEQGMPHEEARKKDKGRSALNGPKARKRFRESYNNLHKRPDWDGHLTFQEVTMWSNGKGVSEDGSGEPLYIDVSKIDLSGVDLSKILKSKNGFIDLLFDVENMKSGPVYGTLKFTIVGPGGEVRVGFEEYKGEANVVDEHDFSNLLFKAINDQLHQGKPEDFLIKCYVCKTEVGM